MTTQPSRTTALPTRPKTDVGALLLTAADIIDLTGYRQHQHHDSPYPGPLLGAPRVDVAGALRIAVSGRPDVDSPTARELVRAVSSFLPGPVNSDAAGYDYAGHVADWCDRPGRTGPEVSASLREFAADVAASAAKRPAPVALTPDRDRSGDAWAEVVAGWLREDAEAGVLDPIVSVVADEGVVLLSVSPESEAVWVTWCERLCVDPERTRWRGPYVTAHGRWVGCEVSLTGLSVANWWVAA